MALVTKPPALDESINTTELSPRNVADVLAQELSGIATAIRGGSDKAPKTDIATVEPTNVASRAYSVGELVYVNGNLYKVITAISGGATFTVGTNIQSADVSGALKDIRQPRTVICGVGMGSSSSYITLFHDFPKNVATMTIVQIFYVGLPVGAPVSIPVSLDKTSGQEWGIPYVYISDANILANMRTYPTMVEVEITYS